MIVIAALYLGPRYSLSAGILVATLAGAGFLITLESAIIIPFFFLQYHNALLFVLFVTNLMFFQILVNAACWMITGNAHLQARAWTFGTSAQGIVAAQPSRVAEESNNTRTNQA